MPSKQAVKSTDEPTQPKKAIPQAPDAAQGPSEQELRETEKYNEQLRQIALSKKDVANAHLEEMAKLAEKDERERAKA